MATQCRAKDPNSCRVHGANGAYDRLQRVADHAAKIGDFDLYSKTRTEMDSLKDDELVPTASPFPEEAVDAAAAIRWTPAGWEKQSADMKELVRNDAREKLTIATPYLIKGRVTTSAITAVAKHSWEARGKGSWNRAGTNERDEFMRHAQRLLKAAEPHMKQDLR